jgi:hypothetical protein
MELNLPASKGLIPGIVDSDQFERTNGERDLPLVWQWNHNPDNEHWSLTERPGYLRTTTGRTDDNIMSARNMLTQRTIGPECTGTTSVDVSGLQDGDVAGLCLLQQNYGVLGVKANGDSKQIVMVKGSAPRPRRGRGRRQESNGASPSDATVEAVPLEQDTIHLRAVCDFRDRTDKARFYYSLDGESWTAIGDGLPSDFGFPMALDPADPDSAYVIPLMADMDRVTPDGRVRVYETRDAGATWTARGDGLPAEHAYLTILRQAFDGAGEGETLELYFGATSGEVFGSGDAGATWSTAASHLPPVYSVRAAA